MTWAAVGIGTATVAGAALSSDAASRASGAQISAGNQSIAAQNAQAATARSDNAPFLRTGTASNARLAQLLGLSGGAGIDVNDPKYTAIRDQLIAGEDAAHQGKYGVSIFDKISGLNAPGERAKFDDRINSQASQQYISKYGDPASATASPDSGSLLRKFSTADLNADPVYNSGLKFGLDRGTEAINSRATASGMYDSGATMKALTQFGNDYGSTKANESFNRYNATNDSIYNKLAGTSGAGQTATSQVSAAGGNAANNISGTLESAGNARAAGVVGGANAWAGAATGANNIYSNYNNNQTLQALLRNNPNYGYGPGGQAGAIASSDRWGL